MIVSMIVWSSSPDQGLDGGAYHAGQQKEGGDQDVKEREGGEGHGGGQVGVLRDVDMHYERLRGEIVWAESSR